MDINTPASGQGLPERTEAMRADNQYYAEAILDERKNNKGNKLYLVKWADYPAEHATWEPGRNISDDVLAEWMLEKTGLDDLDERSKPTKGSGRTKKSAGKNKNAVASPVHEEGAPRDETPGERAKRVFKLDIFDLPHETSSHKASSETPRTPPGPILTRKQVLDEKNADCIIGVDKTRFLMSHKPDPATGETREDLWIPRGLVDKERVAQWERRRQNFVRAIDNEIAMDDPSCPGSRWLARYEYSQTDDALFLKKKVKPAITVVREKSPKDASFFDRDDDEEFTISRPEASRRRKRVAFSGVEDESFTSALETSRQMEKMVGNGEEEGRRDRAPPHLLNSFNSPARSVRRDRVV